MSSRRSVLVRGALAALVLTTVASPVEAQPRDPVQLTFLTFSDWHGQLDPVGGVGGAAVLSAHFQRERAARPHTLTLTAGDSTGASPPLSAFFGDVPAVEALALMGLDANTLGNHEFDRGVVKLNELVELGDHPVVSANLEDPASELTDEVVPYVVRQVGGVKVGIIGVTNDDAPALVQAGRMGSVRVTDPVRAANKARAAAQAEGAKITVALVHMGVTGVDAAGAPVGPLVDFANSVGGFDLIVGDHTDVSFSGVLNGQLVVEDRSKGLTYSRVTLRVDPQNGRVGAASVERVTPSADTVVPDPRIGELLAPYRAQLAGVYDGEIGVATGVFPRGNNVERLQEVALGNLVTDAMRLRYGTRIAFTNGGGLRAALPSSYAPGNTTLRRRAPGYAAGPPYDLVVGDAYAVLPFGNAVVTRTLTGEQLWQALEHGVSALPSANGRFLQVSGLRFTYDPSSPAGSRIRSVTLLDGTPVPRDPSLYSAALPDFLNTGGDGYAMLADGSGVTREVMAEVLREHVATLETVTPVVEGRISGG